MRFRANLSINRLIVGRNVYFKRLFNDVIFMINYCTDRKHLLRAFATLEIFSIFLVIHLFTHISFMKSMNILEHNFIKTCRYINVDFFIFLFSDSPTYSNRKGVCP